MAEWSSVGRALQRARVLYTLPIEAVAGELGVAPSLLRLVEEGSKRPSDRVLGHYAKRFRMKLGELKKARDAPRVRIRHVCSVQLRSSRAVGKDTKLCCGFCGRSLAAVRFAAQAKLGAKPCICDDCVLHCVDVIRRAVYEGEA